MTMDELARRYAAEAVTAHGLTAGHVTEARVREIVAEILADRPLPPDQPTPAFRRLGNDEVLFQVDPDRPITVALDRPSGQIWADSKVYNPGTPLDIVHDHLPAEHRTGYGLQMEVDGTVRSWPMEDGTDVRNGVVTWGGRKWYRIAHQFRLEDGYDAKFNVRYAHGRLVDRGGWRVNTGIDRSRGASTPVTYDGTRGGFHGADYRMRATRPLVWGVEFADHRRFRSTTNLGGPFDLHEPGDKLTGPFICNIENGDLVFGSRTSKTAAPLDYLSTGQADLEHHTLYRYRLPNSGTTRLVAKTVVDGTGRDSLFELYEVGPMGLPLLVHRSTDRFGYSFTDPELNAGFYPIVQLYQWHEWNYPGSRRVDVLGLPLWNHDPSGGNVNRLDLGCFAVSDQVSVERMCEHVASFNPAAYAVAA